MIFERLVLHNFGAYQGEHVIDLSVLLGKPVVLVGALNGSGKTTLLEATQLALFGRAVRGTSRAKMAYPEYLQQLINRNVRPEVGASVGLTFSHRHAGHDDLFTIYPHLAQSRCRGSRRSWRSCATARWTSRPRRAGWSSSRNSCRCSWRTCSCSTVSASRRWRIRNGRRNS